MKTFELNCCVRTITVARGKHDSDQASVDAIAVTGLGDSYSSGQITGLPIPAKFKNLFMPGTNFKLRVEFIEA